MQDNRLSRPHVPPAPLPATVATTIETVTIAMAIDEKVIRRMRHPTTMRPVILGWIEQKYWYVPGASKRWENCYSVRMLHFGRKPLPWSWQLPQTNGDNA